MAGYKLHTQEVRVIIYADRLVDIITEGIVPINEEIEAEEQFEEILRTISKYGKNDKTLGRYLIYHGEFQDLLDHKKNQDLMIQVFKGGS